LLNAQQLFLMDYLHLKHQIMDWYWNLP